MLRIQSLRNQGHMLDFGPAIGASGVQGIFGLSHKPEYKHHKVYKFIPGFNFDGMAFCAKTVTAFKNKGNMSLDKDGFSSLKLFPDCIDVSFQEKMVLNSVRLSNPGIARAIALGYWQERMPEFMISLMTVGDTAAKRLEEVEYICHVISRCADQEWLSRIVLQWNVSCPNVNKDQSELVAESHKHFDLLGKLNIPIIPKINTLLSVDQAVEMLDHPACVALCVSNTLPFGERPDVVDWEELFPYGSPLEAKGYGGGGLSGKPIFPLLLEWLQDAEKSSFDKPIIAGGGILSADDVRRVSAFNSVAAVSLGTVAIVRPWAAQEVINEAHRCLS